MGSRLVNLIRLGSKWRNSVSRAPVEHERASYASGPSLMPVQMRQERANVTRGYSALHVVPAAAGCGFETMSPVEAERVCCFGEHRQQARAGSIENVKVHARNLGRCRFHGVALECQH
jgi:hypothetical protein